MVSELDKKVQADPVLFDKLSSPKVEELQSHVLAVGLVEHDLGQCSYEQPYLASHFDRGQRAHAALFLLASLQLCADLKPDFIPG